MTDERIKELARECEAAITEAMDLLPTLASPEGINERIIERCIREAIDEHDGYLIREVDRLRAALKEDKAT
jgi:hypothetical protein